MAAPISDLYERYKIGTKRVVQWLAETAGKSSGDEKIVSVSMKEITDLADSILEAATISNSPAPNDIHSVIRILEDVIAGRSECAVWYSHATVADERDENFERSQKGHRHFIDVLRTVLDRLRETLKLVTNALGTPQGKKKVQIVTPSPKVTRNIYEGLGVQEPSVEFLAAATAGLNLNPVDNSPASEASPGLSKSAKNRRKKERKKASKAPVFELETQAEDGEFALWCLLKECYQIRLYVRSLWEEYVAGSTSLPIAASMTDRAFVLIRHATDTFAAQFPAFSTIEQVADHLSIDMSVKGKIIESFQCKGSSDVSLEVEAAELLCAPAYLHLLLARHTYNSSHGKEELDPDWDCKVIYQATAHPLTRIALVLSYEIDNRSQEFFDFVTLVGSDNFCMDLARTFGAVSIPLHTVIEYQSYMDIMTMVDDINMISTYTLSKTKEFMQARIQESERQDGGTLKRFAPDRSKSEILTRCQRVMHEGLEDYAHLTKGYDAVRDPFNVWHGYSWVVTLPVFAGVLTRSITSHMFLDGLSLCDAGCVVLSVAHIYRACRSSGLLRRPWKDMDFFISNVDPDCLKLPPAPWSFSALMNSAKYYGKAVGVLAGDLNTKTGSKHTSNSRAPLPSTEQIEQRRVRFRPNKSPASRPASRPKDNKVSAQPRMNAHHDHLFQLVKRYLGDQDSNVDETIRGRWKTSGQITATELLTILKDAMESDELTLVFDYHLFTITCMKLVDYIEEQSDFAIYRKLPVKYTIPQLTDEILWEAAEVGTAGMRAGVRTALGEIANVIEEQYGYMPTENSNIGVHLAFRDRYWRCAPELKSMMAKHSLTAEKSGFNAIGDSSISIAGRDIAAFEAGKLSKEVKERFLKANELVDDIEAMIKADALNGITADESEQAFPAEKQAATSNDDMAGQAAEMPLPEGTE